MSVSNTSSSAVNSIYSSIAAKNKGLGGLVSGLDTESLVESLTLATRSKIAKQQQSKTLLQWKQSAYRSTATLLRDFQGKYFDRLTAANGGMTLSAWYNAYKGTSTSDAVSVNTKTSTAPGSVNISEVTQLATSATMSSKPVDKTIIGGNVDLLGTTWTGKSMEITLNGGTTYTIDLSGLDTSSQTNFEESLNNIINKAILKENYNTATGENKAVTVKIDWSGTNGIIKLNSDGNQITTGDCSVFGIDEGLTNRISTSSKLEELFPDIAGAGYKNNTLIFTVNGKEISAQTTDTLSTVITRINNSGANVKVTFDNLTQTLNMASLETGEHVTLEVGDVQGNLMNQLFGVQGGSTLKTEGNSAKLQYNTSTAKSNALTTTQLKDLVDKLIAENGKVTLLINDVKHELTVSMSNDDIAAINDAIDKEVDKRMQEWLKEQIETETPPFTSGSNDKYEDLTAAEQAEYDTIKSQMILDVRDDLEHDLYAKQYTSAVNSAITEALGEKSGISFSYNSDDGTFTFHTTNAETRLEVKTTDTIASDEIDLFNKLYGPADPLDPIPVIDNTSGVTSDTLDKLGVTEGGTINVTIGTAPTKTITYGPTTTLDELIEKFRGIDGIELRVENGRIYLDGGSNIIHLEDTGGEDGFLNAVFGVPVDENGDVVYQTSPQKDTYKPQTNGQDAIIVIDGTSIKQSSNNFVINGVGFTVNETYSAAANDGKSITITVTADHEELAAKLKEFIDDYNTLYAALSNIITERPYKESDGTTYPPLTEEQKAEMTEKEIEQWETKAKQGLLFNDDAIRRILSSMRASFYETFESAGLAPYEIGITTISLTNSTYETVDYTKSGQLVLDEDKLLAALETNGDLVRVMFQDGLVTKLDDIINSAVNESSNDGTNASEDSKFVRGTLVTLAGTDKLTGDNTSILGKRIEAIDEYISRLKYRLEVEYKRYWKQFTALETALANMSAQSSWLTENA